MAHAADPRQGDDLPELPRLELARDRCVAVEAHVRAVFVAVGGALANQMQGMTLTEHDHVIEQLQAKGAHAVDRHQTMSTSWVVLGTRTWWIRAVAPTIT